MKNYKYYSVITGLFTACLVISNILDTKIFSFLSFDLPGGIVLFPIVYVFGDILTEIYGYSHSRKVIWTGFAALMLMIVTSTLVQYLPAASFWTLQPQYDAILGKVPRIVMASVSAYLCGEFVNATVIAKMKVKSQGRHLPLRLILSTIAGQLVDTTIFVVIAFAGVLPNASLLSVIFSGWLVKVVWEIVALPLTLPLIRWLKRSEGENYFDETTNFNPFKLS